MAARDVLGVKMIPAEGGSVVCARSQHICALSYTQHAAQSGHDAPSHAIAESKGMRGEHSWRGSLLIATLSDTEPLIVWGRYLHQVADAVIEAHITLTREFSRIQHI
jgi:hypothetical protein